MQQDVPKEEIMYKTKLIQFLGRTTPIILQNENGPCPLIAICNVLLLRNNLNLNPDCYEVSQERLLSLVVGRLVDSNSKVHNKDEGYIENQQQNIADAIDLLPRLTTGIDVNIKFRRIDDFEFTPECAIFDLLDIPLYHGWIVDPQDVQAANAIGSKSYNAIMADPSLLETQQYGHARGEIVRNFLNNTRNQLTIFGLICLHEGLKERELCIFFRNNHFCTMFKYEGELYLLATDKGYLNYPDLVWEKLNEVNGDTAFVTATFTNFKVDNGTSGASNTWTDYLANNNNVSDTGREVNCDLQLAITMQEEEYNKQPTSVGACPQVPRNSHRTSSSAPLGRKASKCKIM